MLLCSFCEDVLVVIVWWWCVVVVVLGVGGKCLWFVGWCFVIVGWSVQFEQGYVDYVEVVVVVGCVVVGVGIVGVGEVECCDFLFVFVEVFDYQVFVWFQYIVVVFQVVWLVVEYVQVVYCGDYFVGCVVEVVQLQLVVLVFMIL